MKMISCFIGFFCFLSPVFGVQASIPQHGNHPFNIIRNQALVGVPLAPIPPKQRNVSFISRWVIFGTFFTQFMLKRDDANFRKALNQAWNKEINSIVGSSTFKESLTPQDLNLLDQLLWEYKQLGKSYINKVLNFKRANRFKHLLDEWQEKGQEIALFFQSHQFDPFNELPKWFRKATNSLADEVQAFVKNDLSFEGSGFFARYGSPIRNFEEIGFTLSPSPCVE